MARDAERQGAYVNASLINSAGYNAGLRRGDVILVRLGLPTPTPSSIQLYAPSARAHVPRTFAGRRHAQEESWSFGQCQPFSPSSSSSRPVHGLVCSRKRREGGDGGGRDPVIPR